MWEKLKNVILTILAVFGVLFILLLLWPEDDAEEVSEETTIEEMAQQVSAGEEKEEDPKETGESKEDTEDPKETGESGEESEDSEEPGESKEDTEESEENTSDDKQETEEKEEAAENSLNIEGDGESIVFRTLTLDNEEVTQGIFSDYDLTLVYVWGTYCSSCRAEVDDYGELYRNLPENVNLIGIVCDVYDGIDNNVKEAKSILKENKAEFKNLGISDSLYELTDDFQYIPSAFFVDRNGRIIGDKMESAGFKEVKKRLAGYLMLGNSK